MKDFAIHLDVHEGTLNRIINGKQDISKKLAVQFARKLGDPRFYTLENLPAPDLDFEKLMKVWPFIPENKRRALREQGESYVKENRKRREPSESDG